MIGSDPRGLRIPGVSLGIGYAGAAIFRSGRDGAEDGMSLFPGARMWLPCEVKPGPFSDERVVLVVAEDSEWLGFVNVRWLRRHGSEDRDEVLAKVVDIDGPTFHARIPGNALQARLFQGRVDHAVPGDPVQA